MLGPGNEQAMAQPHRKFERDSREGAVRLVLFKPLTQPEIGRIADPVFNDPAYPAGRAPDNT